MTHPGGLFRLLVAVRSSKGGKSVRYCILNLIISFALASNAFAGIALLTQERTVSALAVATATPDKPDGDTKSATFSAPDFGDFDQEAEAFLISAGDEFESPTLFGASASMQSVISLNSVGVSVFAEGLLTHDVAPVDAKIADARAIFKVTFTTDSSYRYSWRFASLAGGESPNLRDQDGNLLPQTLDGLLDAGMYTISMNAVLNQDNGSGATAGYFIEFSTQSVTPIPLPSAAWASLPLLALIFGLTVRKSVILQVH